jgi:hypothetical protein
MVCSDSVSLETLLDQAKEEIVYMLIQDMSTASTSTAYCRNYYIPHFLNTYVQDWKNWETYAQHKNICMFTLF